MSAAAFARGNIIDPIDTFHLEGYILTRLDYCEIAAWIEYFLQLYGCFW